MRARAPTCLGPLERSSSQVSKEVGKACHLPSIELSNSLNPLSLTQLIKTVQCEKADPSTIMSALSGPVVIHEFNYQRFQHRRGRDR